MATRLEAFPDDKDSSGQQRKYPWDEWTDGGTWQIRRNEDYDVPTENMRVNLHMKASQQACKVKTKKLSDEKGEGLIFQFFDPEDGGSGNGNTAPEGSIDLLYRDALDIYETARREVTIPRSDGTRQKYAAVRYKQQIERAYDDGRLVSAITRIVSRRTEGFGHLEAANRPDLMVETLVLDTDKPYHGLFSAATVDKARDRMADYAARHPHEDVDDKADATERVTQLSDHTTASIKECQRLGYNPTRWAQMVNEDGALDAHKRVLHPGPPNNGFVTLAYTMNPPHPELTAEYAALHKFPDLFTDEELAVARGRLEN